MPNRVYPSSITGHNRLAGRLIPAVLLFTLGGFPVAPVAEEPEPEKKEPRSQQTFETADDAVKALVKALDDDSLAEMLNLFNSEYRNELIGGDKAAARHDLTQVKYAVDQGWVLEDDGENRRTLVIGNAEWPFPFPLVKQDKRWRFDTAAGIEEVINRRIGANERNAIAMCAEYIDAQLEYAAEDRDGDKVLEYARQIISTPGEQNGLYWASDNRAQQSPFGPLVADARGYLQGREVGDPYRGYYFKVLSRQGEYQPGGRYDYVINGNMIAGFALVSYPADYGNSGIMSFVCSHQGVVYQADLGEQSDLIAGGMDVYNPAGEDWSEVKNDDDAASQTPADSAADKSKP